MHSLVDSYRCPDEGLHLQSFLTWWNQETKKFNATLVSTRQDSNLGLLDVKTCDLYVFTLPKHDIFLKHERDLFLSYHTLSVASQCIPQANDVSVPFFILLPLAFSCTPYSYLPGWLPFFQACHAYSCFHAFAMLFSSSWRTLFFAFLFSLKC